MGTQRDLMGSGEPYLSMHHELERDRRHARRVMRAFNTTHPDAEDERAELLRGFLAHFGEGSLIEPTLQVEYGYHTRIGRDTFLNFDAILLDCGPITIGDRVQIGPRAQLLTALHPVDDHAARHAGWETTAPITVEDGVWFGAGVIVCPGVTIGRNSVVGAGSVVTRDIPDHVLAVGNPARVVRKLGHAQ